tara:strand:+ start:215 stop:529 length:315 start_codon:yes stop_codon:yes gene_type:complete
MSDEKVKPTIEDRINEIRENSELVEVDLSAPFGELPMIDGEEAVALCPECNALIWIADPGGLGQLYLMRICEIDADECVTCSRAREAVQDPDIPGVLREMMGDE